MSKHGNNPAKSVYTCGPGCKGFKIDDHKRLAKEAKQLRTMLEDCKVLPKHWQRHDDVNLVELYMDIKSDLAFIAYWTMPHKKWMKKYS